MNEFKNIKMPQVLFYLASRKSSVKEVMLSLKTDSQEQFFERVFSYVVPNYNFNSCLHPIFYYKHKQLLKKLAGKQNKKLFILLLDFINFTGIYLTDVPQKDLEETIKRNMTMTYKIFQGYISLLEQPNNYEKIHNSYRVEQINKVNSDLFGGFITVDKNKQDELNNQIDNLTKNSAFSGHEYIPRARLTINLNEKPTSVELDYLKFNDPNTELMIKWFRTLGEYYYIYSILLEEAGAKIYDISKLYDYKITVNLPFGAYKLTD